MKTSKLLHNVILPIIILIIVIISSFLYKNTYSQIVRNILINAFCYILFYLSYSQIIKNNNFIFTKEYNPLENIILDILIVIAYVAAALFPLFSVSLWVFPAIIVLIALYSNLIPSYILATGLISYSCMLAEINVGIFIIIFLTSFTVALIMTRIEYGFNRLLSYCISIIVIITELIFLIVFYINGLNLSETIIFPIFNLIANIGIIASACNFLNNKYYKKRNNIYNKITDWSFPLLLELKNSNIENYKKTVHICHYANLIGKELDLDKQLIKAGASYSCIFTIFDNDKNKLLSLINDIEFPSELKNLISEISDDKIIFSTSESFVVSLSKTLVSAINKLKDSGKSVENIYGPLVNSVINAYYSSNRLNKLNISFNQFEKIKNILLEENKYLKIMIG